MVEGPCGDFFVFFCAIVSGALVCYFLAEAAEFRVNFFGFKLNLCFDKIAEDFLIDGGFNIDSHGCILCCSTIKDGFEFLGHGMFAGDGFVCCDLTGPTFNELLLEEGGVCSKEGVEDDLMDG